MEAVYGRGMPRPHASQPIGRPSEVLIGARHAALDRETFSMDRLIPTPIGELSFRDATDADLGFLAQLYASTRQEELKQVPWTEEQKADFLRMQFDAQHSFYRRQFPDADFLVMTLDERPIGRIYIDRREDEIRLVDIAFLPEFRGGGAGKAVLDRLLDEGRQQGKIVRIHVERFNPALRLYRRLGFEEVDNHGVYYLMEWKPE